MQPTLTVNLCALADNYRRLVKQFSGPSVAAVVKADAYGLGVVEVSKALIAEGCQQLFVATLEEGIALKTALSEADTPSHTIPKIAVFHGPYKGQEEEFVAHGLIPVINYVSQLERWIVKSAPATRAPYFLHVDTGMCRLGLGASDMKWLSQHGDHLLARKPDYLLSHLACANRKDHPKNAEQLAAFRQMQAYLPEVPTSFCNSSGVYLDRVYHGHMARPGSALYGINPAAWLDKNPMQHVADLTAPIIMIRTLDQTETIGYGATSTREAGSRIATVQMGYADGYLRYLSRKGTVYMAGLPCPVIGRVSMDMIAVDISSVPESELHHHTRISIICAEQPVDHVAMQASTIGYEIFTSLGERVKREYITTESANPR